MESCCDKYNGDSNFTYPLFIIDTSGKHKYCVLSHYKIPSPGWSCKDDTEEISTMLTDLLGLLTNANPKVVIQVLQSVKYEPLLTLVEYYQLVR